MDLDTVAVFIDTDQRNTNRLHYSFLQSNCTNGKVRDIQFDSRNGKEINGKWQLFRNQDGLDLRRGCRNILIENIKGIKEIFGEGYMSYCSSEIETLKKISTYINNVSADVEALVEARKVANRVEDIAQRAKMYSHQVKDMMDKVRLSADNLEMLIDDEVWPLPKYRELLFF